MVNAGANMKPVEKTAKEGYVDLRRVQGGITTFDNAKRTVERYVRDTLFSMKKFITNDCELEYSGKELL
jgi:hypothetical protein